MTSLTAPDATGAVRDGGRRGRRVAGLAVAIAFASAVGGIAAAPVPASARAAAPAAAAQELARLETTHRVHTSPSSRSRVVAVIGPWAPITGGATVLPVTSSATATGGARWLRIMVPGRPNGRQGWIEQRGTQRGSTRWKLVVKTASRRVIAYRDGRIVRVFAAVVGKPSTPTPHGSFFVEESVRVPPGGSGGPFALATSARSSVLQEFDGGPGQIGIHGVQQLGGVPGTAVSHGCIRLANAAIRWLAARIGSGVRVTITR
jgi:lipoprotein-anchoring transpeptidase ErfK/SrfK